MDALVDVALLQALVKLSALFARQVVLLVKWYRLLARWPQNLVLVNQIGQQVHCLRVVLAIFAHAFNDFLASTLAKALVLSSELPLLDLVFKIAFFQTFILTFRILALV